MSGFCGEVRANRRIFEVGSGSSGDLRGVWRGPFCGSKGRVSGSEIVRVAWLMRAGFADTCSVN